MIERKIHQVVLSPSTEQAIIDKVEAKIEGLQERASLWLKIKSLIGALIHPLGFHFWVSWVSYDVASDRLVDTGLTCRFCPLSRQM